MILILDFETYFDKEYSLRNMPTMQYIRDPRFKVLGVALKTLGNPAKWVPAERVEAALRTLPWDHITCVCHNAQFDGAILHEVYGIKPKAYLCTMFAARYAIAQGVLPPHLTTSLAVLGAHLGHEKGNIEQDDLGTYAKNDVDITEKLYHEVAPALPPMERGLIDLHVRMAAEPVLDLDLTALQSMADKDRAEEKFYPLVRKDSAFVKMLRELGVEAEYKTTPKGQTKLALAKTDKFMDKLLNHADPRVARLARLRQSAYSTIERSRSQRFVDVSSPLPVPLLYYGAHTGRSSGLDKLNLQNLGREGGMRATLRAPEGYKLVIGDSSQIEVRVLAWHAGEERLLQVFRDKQDPYKVFASENLYGVPQEDVAKDQRQVAKAAVLALGFGQGAGGFLGYCERFGIPMTAELSERVVSVYRGTYAAIKRYWKSREFEVRTTGRQRLPSGRELVYPYFQQTRDGYSYERMAIFRKTKSEGPVPVWHGLLTENLVQASARDVVFAQALRLHEAGYKIVNLVHDEIILCVPDAQVEEAKLALEQSLQRAPDYYPDLPVSGEVHVSQEYNK